MTAALLQSVSRERRKEVKEEKVKEERGEKKKPSHCSGFSASRRFRGRIEEKQ